MKRVTRCMSALVCCALSSVAAVAFGEQVRIATYNIEHFNANVRADRVTRIKAVIASLDANVIGLEEIENRTALQRVFDPNEWQLVIDDDSNDGQDVAAAIRKPLQVISPADFEADDEHFLFPSPSNNNWPKRRDGLKVEIRDPASGTEFTLVVIHAKARVGGRNATDNRRIGAARDLITSLESRLDDTHYVLVGDWNDNPDDRSMNILESGDRNMLGGPEEIDGPFLRNLTEPLLLEDRVSWGLSAANVVAGRINTQVAGSRALNNAGRGTADSERPILFDQILVSPGFARMHVAGSTKVFDDPVAFIGGPRASDHVPVSAVFDLDSSDGPPPNGTGSSVTGVRIISASPDPQGPDAGNEVVTLKNHGTTAVNLSGWRLRDRASNVVDLTGTIPPNGEKEIHLASGQLPLNNSGDDISLVNQAHQIVHSVSYSAEQVSPGVVITFSDD